MKKKYIIIGAVFVFILVIGFFVTRKPNEPTSDQLPVPQIPNQIGGSMPPINLEVNEKDFLFPHSVPLLDNQGGSQISMAEATKIATSLGFNNQPINTEDAVGGNTYIWTSDTASFVFYTKTNQMDYSVNSIPQQVAGKNLSDDDRTKISQDFLTSKFLIDKSKVVFSNFLFLNAASETVNPTTKDKANIYQVNFSPVELDYKILRLNPQQSTMYVWMLPNGAVAKVHVVKLNLTKTQQLYSIKNYTQVKDNLKNAVLISVDNGNENVLDLSASSFSNIKISKVELTYLVDQTNSQFYQPVYLLTGTADIQGFKNNANVSFYLPALVGK